MVRPTITLNAVRLWPPFAVRELGKRRLMQCKVDLTNNPLDPLLARDFVQSPNAGAIVAFEGVTRADFDGKSVIHLSYEAHPSLARKSLEEIANTALTKFGLIKVYIVHRLGLVPVGESSILIYVSSAHRTPAWQAGEWILERVKESVEIWKNETYADGSAVWKVNDGSCPGRLLDNKR